MTHTKSFALAVLAGTLVLTPMRADQSDKKTIITIDAPVQLPTTTLQPGTYTIKLLDSASNRHIVTVWDKDGLKLVTTVLAIPNYRLQPTGTSNFTFWETPANHPKALRAWFYPGDNFGQEFAYPKSIAREIAMVAKTEVPTLSSTDETTFGGQTASANGGDVNAERSNKEVVAEPASPVAPEPTPVNTAPAVTPEPDPAPVPAPAPAVTAKEEPQQPAAAPAEALPHTATNWRELMLLGFLTAITGLTTFISRKERV